MKNTRSNNFVSATDNYKIDRGSYDFLICKIENREDCRTVSIKCKMLKTAIRRVINKVDQSVEIIDYEVAVNNAGVSTFINLHSLNSDNQIHEYLS